MSRSIIRNNIVGLPCSLHDCRVTGIALEGNCLRLMFENGFYVITDGVPEHAAGYVRFDGIDLDYCAAYILSRNGAEGVFTGKKMSIDKFAESFAGLAFEIIEEAYGYNVTKLQGFLIGRDCINEFILDLYHEGRMSYIIE